MAHSAKQHANATSWVTCPAAPATAYLPPTCPCNMPRSVKLRSEHIQETTPTAASAAACRRIQPHTNEYTQAASAAGYKGIYPGSSCSGMRGHQPMATSPETPQPHTPAAQRPPRLEHMRLRTMVFLVSPTVHTFTRLSCPPVSTNEPV
eukprot:360121-Chlamydomonas_euryale.AAC.17